LFHGKVHPRNLAKLEVESFLTHLAVDRNVAPSTQNQALAALIFLYAKVLGVNMPWLDDVVRATSPVRLPVVLTKPEVLRLIEKVAVAQRLVVRLMYGTGMRVMEAVRLRVLDVDFSSGLIMVRDGKGRKDRRAILPLSLIDEFHSMSGIERRGTGRWRYPERCPKNSSMRVTNPCGSLYFQRRD